MIIIATWPQTGPHICLLKFDYNIVLKYIKWKVGLLGLQLMALGIIGHNNLHFAPELYPCLLKLFLTCTQSLRRTLGLVILNWPANTLHLCANREHGMCLHHLRWELWVKTPGVSSSHTGYLNQWRDGTWNKIALPHLLTHACSLWILTKDVLTLLKN